MTFRERIKAVINNFVWQQDWNIQEYAVRKRNIEYRRGKADAYGDVVHMLDEVLDEFPEEPVGNSDKMTLTELAHELRKLLKFKYLAYGNVFIWGQPYYVLWMSNEPLTLTVRDEGGECRPCYIYEWEGKDIIATLFEEDLVFSLDLSEYMDNQGNIDYSKCIVEVEA